jgi:hypothetical protein
VVIAMLDQGMETDDPLANVSLFGRDKITAVRQIQLHQTALQ